MQHRMERLKELTQVEPPASLDALVRERMQHVLAAHFTGAEGQVVGAEPVGAEPVGAGPVGGQPPQHAALVPASPWARVESSPAAAGGPAVSLPLAERCVYAVGLMAYGVHALGAAARLLWRAVVG